MTRKEIFERTQVIIQLTEQHFTPKEISERLNMKEARVRRILRSVKIKPYKVSRLDTCENAKKIIERLNKGMGLSEIARELNVSRQYVFLVKKRNFLK